jgi:hypothetical protein
VAAVETVSAEEGAMGPNPQVSDPSVFPAIPGAHGEETEEGSLKIGDFHDFFLAPSPATLFYFSPLLLCWVGVHCGIYKGFCKV